MAADRVYGNRKGMAIGAEGWVGMFSFVLRMYKEKKTRKLGKSVNPPMCPQVVHTFSMAPPPLKYPITEAKATDQIVQMYDLMRHIYHTNHHSMTMQASLLKFSASRINEWINSYMKGVGGTHWKEWVRWKPEITVGSRNKRLWSKYFIYIYGFLQRKK